MNGGEVARFVVSFLEQTGCRIIERSPSHVVVKLSPEADRALTNRPFYWSFVDRTGAEPETMTFAWHFEPPGTPASSAPGASAPAASSSASAGSAGTVPASSPAALSGPAVPGYSFASDAAGTGIAAAIAGTTALPLPGGRVLTEYLHFGSARLHQIFDYVRQRGRNVLLFAEPPRGARSADPFSRAYTAWLGVNFKVAFECDMKREDLYSWGISLATGVIDENFGERLKACKLTARLSPEIRLLMSTLKPRKGMARLEAHLERKLRRGDFSWAVEAEERRREELERVSHYYRQLIGRADSEEQRRTLEERLKDREAEIDRQFRPRMTVTVINCGIFHFPGID
ncbi:MAG: hypothetical protein BAA02_09500 [Paenibacillaceae bacterium ZCTH02-B3]|nr:MAG: hypothetical protein BAA02_09500 [Paenibacillaceae bacterium ZCTH02-B3]